MEQADRDAARSVCRPMLETLRQTWEECISAVRIGDHRGYE
jgi:hypothetical protein